MTSNIDVISSLKNLCFLYQPQSMTGFTFSIFDQLIRSGISVGANIVEAKSGSSTKDFKNFYTIALKSANETKHWICLIRDTILLNEKEKLNELLTEVDEISKIIASIIINLK